MSRTSTKTQTKKSTIAEQLPIVPQKEKAPFRDEHVCKIYYKKTYVADVVENGKVKQISKVFDEVWCLHSFQEDIEHSKECLRSKWKFLKKTGCTPEKATVQANLREIWYYEENLTNLNKRFVSGTTEIAP